VFSDDRKLDSTWAAYRRGLDADRARYGFGAVFQHAVRRLPAFLLKDRIEPILGSPSFLAHTRAEGDDDPLSFLSHRYYLINGLSWAERAEAATAHYRTIDQTLSDKALATVFSDEGLELWRSDWNGTAFDLRLMRGRDVTFEGGLTVLLRIDGAPLSVLSFSIVPTPVLHTGIAGLPPFMPVVTRKQTSSDDTARRIHEHAFIGCHPARQTFAAFSGIVRALGHDIAAGVAGRAHPSWEAERARQFVNSYDVFWESLSGTPRGPLVWLVPLPVEHPSVDHMKPARRNRALRRRRHLDEVELIASEMLETLLRHKPATGGLRLSA